MSDLFGNHIVGFPTRRLNYVSISSGDLKVCNEGLVACPQPDGSISCVQDTIGCGKLAILCCFVVVAWLKSQYHFSFMVLGAL